MGAYSSGPKRLNSFAVCHVYKELSDKMDLHQIAKDFTSKSTTSRNRFGNI